MKLRLDHPRIFPTILNILGLSLAFAVFMILSVQVRYDIRYDRNYDGNDRIVRVEYSEPTSPGQYSTVLSRAFIEHLKMTIPQAEAISCYRYFKGASSTFKETGSDRSGVQLRVSESDFDLLNIFPFKFVQGDTSGYHAPLTAVISKKGAKRLFGRESPVGREIQEDTPGSTPYRIVAVYEDFPENSSADNEIILNIGDECIGDWSEWSFPCYMKISAGTGLDAALDSAKTVLFGEEFKNNVDIRVSGLHKAYFSKDIIGDNMAKGSFPMTFTLMSVSVLVLLIAIINFINFAMASVPFTIKGINTRRVLGSSRAQQVWSQLAGALGLVLISFALSIGVMSMTASTSFASYISGSLKIEDNLPVIFSGLATAVATAFIAGILPARYSTSFSPAIVLKGVFSLSARGRRLRTALVGFQYVISFVLIICALFITVQIRYMKSFDMGFDRDRILEFTVSPKIGENRETLRQMLLENQDIQDVTFAGNRLVSQGKMGWGRSWQGERVQMDCLPVDRNFISFFGMEITDGRDFTESDDKSSSGTFIVNEAFMDKYPFLKLGVKITGHQGDDNPAEIAGVVRNFNFQPLQYGISPLVLYNFGAEPWWPLMIGYARINPHKAGEIMQYIRSKCAELDPSFDTSSMSLRFMNENIGHLYYKEDNLSRLISVAAAISLLISIIGIIGLVYFETQFRRKEIALRRVNGAQVADILAMLNRYYLIITVCCFAVAAPVATVIIHRWVSSFTYQSPVPVWIFLAALFAISTVTIVTVTMQSRRAALRNPSDSLRTE